MSKGEHMKKSINTANSRQVGGEHYKTPYEHWDLVENTNMRYMEGNATKYISRWRKKAGGKDLDKAMHYVDKLLEQNPKGFKYIRIRPVEIYIRKEVAAFCAANELHPTEECLIRSLATWETVQDLKLIKLLLVGLTEGYRAMSFMVPSAVDR